MSASESDDSERSHRLLVLGAGGFLGAQLVCRAALAGEVLAASRSKPPSRVLEACDEYLPWDAADPGAASSLIERYRPHAVILSAALSRVGACESNPELAHALNARLPAELARACSQAGVRFLHVSTDLVFGADVPPPTGFDEAQPTAPVQVYGRTKAAGEEAVLAQNPGALVVRLPLLFGDSMGRGIGASDVLEAALERGERPFLFEDEFRTPIDVEVAADALLECARGDQAGILHLAGPERLSRFELGQRLLARLGLDPAVRLQRGSRRNAENPEQRPADVSLNSSRARGSLSTRLVGVGRRSP